MTQKKLMFAVLSKFLLGAIVVSMGLGGLEGYIQTKSTTHLFVVSLAIGVFVYLFFSLSDSVEKYTKEMSKK